MTRLSPNTVMRVGFVTVLILMGIQAMLALFEIKRVNQEITNIVEVVNKKIEYATEMREAIRLRRLMLSRMLATQDFFKRDELLMEAYGYARKYRDARIKLTRLNTDETEKKLHKLLTAETRKSQALTRQVFERVMTDDLYEDISHDLDAALVEQTKVMNLLDQLVSLQKQYSITAKNEAKAATSNLEIQILVIGTTILLLSIMIFSVVSRYVSCQNRAIIEATEKKSQFLAAMSHELRTPLSAVIGFAESLNEPEIEQQDIHYAADSIVKASNHLLSLINDILDISKVEAGHMELTIQDEEIAELCRDIEGVVSQLALSKGILFKLVYHEPIPKILATDAVRLKQIILNLCGNAVKFTQEGEVRLEIRHDNQNDALEFAVIDTGIGLTQAQIAKLFTPFTQADPSITQQYGGTGLGLYLSKQLAEFMGGTIQVRSEHQKGSTFTVIVPLNPPQTHVVTLGEKPHN